jgi:hypothetical protein
MIKSDNFFPAKTIREVFIDLNLIISPQLDCKSIIFYGMLIHYHAFKVSVIILTLVKNDDNLVLCSNLAYN